MSKPPEQVIREEILALKAYHVPDAAGMVKLDAMENPYGLPEELRGELARIVDEAELNRYPDPGARALKTRLRAVLGIPGDSEILLGNGSDELIQMLIMATARPDAAVLGVEPSFVMFRMIAGFCRVRFEAVPLRPDYALDGEAMLGAIAALQPALIFLAYPNNPSGNLFDDEWLARIIEAAPGLVVIDEAYHAFAGKSWLPRLTDYPNLLVMRTLSKLGLAGLRLGLIAGRKEWLSEVDKVRLPYNINVLTQRMAERVLQRHDVLERQAQAIKVERAALLRTLHGITGVTPYPSAANFILFRIPDASLVFERLKERCILIKNLHGSHPALANCLRVTVGTPEENKRFLSALREVASDISSAGSGARRPP
jgi:histidinol-phosphate aminotransferase